MRQAELMSQISIRVFTVFFIFIIPGLPLSAQDPVPVKRSGEKVIIEGAIYYLHSVKPGQTLYSISRAYKVREKDIALENPGVYSGLQIGQILKIPVITPELDYDDEPGYDTTRYIQHILEEGENLYSLSRKYNLTIEDIEEVNPGADPRNLSIGQGILIPRLNTIVSNDSFIIHKVRRQETLYSLAKRYNIEERDIRLYNPELEWGGLKAEQVLRIPRPWIIGEKQNTMQAPNTQDSIQDAYPGIVVIPVQPEDTLPRVDLSDMMYRLRSVNGKNLKVAYLIPFNYRQDTIFNEKTEMDRTEGEVEGEEEVKQEELLPGSINFLEFMEGSLLALDSLAMEGLNLDVHFYDTRKSPTRVREILREERMREVDLIIGPFFTYNVEIVSEFSRRYGIPMVSPFHTEEVVTRTNPYLFQMNPSVKTEFRNAAKLLAREYDKNIVFIYSADSLEFHRKDFFKQELLSEIGKYTHSDNVVFKEIVYDNAAKANLSKDLSQTLSKDRMNLIIIPEEEEAFVSTLINQLYFKLRDFNIEVFGMPHWAELDNLEVRYLHELNARFLSPYYYSYDDLEVKSFLQDFRENYKAEPILKTHKGCSYAFAGYDITYYFLHAMSRYERRFLLRLNDINYPSLLPEYEFHRFSEYGGFENRGMYLVKYLPGYEFEIRKLIEQPDFEDFRMRTPFTDELRP